MDIIQGAVIAIDKPYGISSFGALARCRWLLSQRLGRKVKIGHAGTLDPLATGVLILCTGKCTKEIETFQQYTKEYVATLHIGATTPSHDMEHEINATYRTEHIDREMIERVLPQFIGEIEQVPPSFSAVKVDGKRAYHRKRKGEEVVLKPKRVFIKEIEICHFDPQAMTLELRVVCGKGTYIRALARDLGRALDSGAYLTALRRTRIGNFHIEDCIRLDAFEAWAEEMVPLSTNE